MARRENELDLEIQALYRGPFDELIAARNALAVRLRKEKRVEDAARVKLLPKPTPSAWAVNLLFEREAKKMADLLAAGETARSAQNEAVSGRGVEPLREAIRDARRLADELRWDAARLLTEQGRDPSRAIVERIAANLQALAFSPAAAEEAARGWLDRDLDPPGFEVLAGLQLAGAPAVTKVVKKDEKEEERPEPAPRPRLVRHPDKDKEKEEEERKKREAAEQARLRRIALAEEKAEQARAEADPLRKEAEQAAAAAAVARRQAEEKEKAAARARERYEQAAERLARAEAALREAREGK